MASGVLTMPRTVCATPKAVPPTRITAPVARPNPKPFRPPSPPCWAPLIVQATTLPTLPTMLVPTVFTPCASPSAASLGRVCAHHCSIVGPVSSGTSSPLLANVVQPCPFSDTASSALADEGPSAGMALTSSPLFERGCTAAGAVCGNAFSVVSLALSGAGCTPTGTVSGALVASTVADETLAGSLATTISGVSGNVAASSFAASMAAAVAGTKWCNSDMIVNLIAVAGPNFAATHSHPSSDVHSSSWVSFLALSNSNFKFGGGNPAKATKEVVCSLGFAIAIDK
mmetsp:Transcript_2476/g.7289  ORF Transcript_2476/g.7289 Transcript_2476/m.7289 type:complete len:285 (+) Transcript_2476:1610-2464(+)